ncbi:hypothetical protein C0995_015722, partial [Termitomyces sp. Mi166
MTLDQGSSPSTFIILFHFPPHSNFILMTSAFLGRLHSSLARSFTIEVMLQLTGTTYTALINSGTKGTFVSSELALSGKEIGEPIKLQLFNNTPATSELIIHHHSDIISLAN